VDQLGEIGDALGAARWTWLTAAALASAATYPMAAAQLIGAAGTRLPALQTIAAQVASAVGGVLAPGGIGGAGVNARYLERSGKGRAESVAAVTLTNTAGFAVHMAALVTLGGILTGTGVPPIPVPSRWILLAVVIGIATLAGAVAWSPVGHRRPPAPVREMALSLWDVLRRPRQAASRLAMFSPCGARCAHSGSSRRPWRSPWPTWRGQRSGPRARRRAASARSTPR
jgi:hypothetical protein